MHVLHERPVSLLILSDSGINNVKVQYTALRPGDVKRNFSDTSKAQQILGWEVNMNLEKGLKQTVEWFLNQL